MNDVNALQLERRRLQERYDDQPDSRVFAPLADCLRKLGDLQEALGVCHSGLAKHPRYSSAYVILGKIHLERGDDAAAREAFEHVLGIDPQNLLALRQLAELDEAGGDHEAAVARWEQVCALEIAPEKAEERLEAARARAADPSLVADDASDVTDDAPEAESPIADEEEAIEPEAEADADEDVVDYSVVGEIEDRTHEVRPVTPEDPASDTLDDGATVPDSEALLPLAQVDDDVEEDDGVVDGIPTTEIATMTLAEIYAEQGFREKALEILGQVRDRNPQAEQVARRIAELEALDDAAVEDDVARLEAESADLTPEPVTLNAAPTEVDEAEASESVEAQPAPPLTARTSPESEHDRERERYGHFKNWLDRIRVDD